MMKASHIVIVGFEMEGELMLLQQAIAYISRKKNEESGSLSDSPLDPFLLVFLFPAVQIGAEDHIKQSAGTSFALTSKQGIGPLL